MQKIYNITGLRFQEDYLILTIDDHEWRFKKSEISEKLSLATEDQLNDYHISPSGYGIHWGLLDEDISINGLLKTTYSQHAL